MTTQEQCVKYVFGAALEKKNFVSYAFACDKI